MYNYYEFIAWNHRLVTLHIHHCDKDLSFMVLVSADPLSMHVLIIILLNLSL